MSLQIKPKEEIKETPKHNPLLDETFGEFKKRIFTRNHNRLNFLIHYRKDMFVGYHIKSYPGYQVDLMLAGTLVMRLFNHEVTFYVNNELVSFLKMFIKKNPNESLDVSNTEVTELIKNFVGEQNPFVN